MDEEEKEEFMQASKEDDFLTDLTYWINMYNQDQECDTPDWILAQYIEACLDALAKAIRMREAWFGRQDAE